MNLRASGRAQRASARQQGSNAADPTTTLAPTVLPAAQPPPAPAVDSDNAAMMVDDDLALSRSASSVNLQLQDPPPPQAATKTKRKDKGKGKEVETLQPRVKEEPKALSLHTPEPTNNLLNNEDHCSSCRFSGELVYCDGCPKAFHLWCLDPPLESVDDARWFCPTCMSRKHPPRKPPPSLFSAVIHHVQVMHPIEYQLPEEIRTFFKDVGTGPKGNYIDTFDLKPPRLNRHGQLEDRDPYRLRDRNGGPVLCHRCGQSALPDSLSSSAPASKRPRRSNAASPDAWKSLVSCDHCNLHWHLDCLDPPLPTIPPFNKKWMCPNHADRVLPPKRRIPRQHAPPIEISKPRQFNNGNIDVIHPQYTSAAPAPSVPVDEVLINGRRYRVPEKIIVLDFWNKLNKVDEDSQRDEIVTDLSSPLTELSSLDEDDASSSQSVDMTKGDFDEHAAAQVLFGLSSKGPSANALGLHNMPKKLVDRSVQTEWDPPSLSGAPSKNKVGRPRKHPMVAEPIHGHTTTSITSESATTSSNLTVKRKRVSQQIVPKLSSRALRSRSRNTNTDASNGALSRDSLPQGEEPVQDNDASVGSIASIALAQPKLMNVKVEEVETPFNQPLLRDAPETSGVEPPKARIIRPPRQAVSWQKAAIGAIKDTKEKRGRKRKTREDEMPGGDGENGFDLKDSPDLAKTSGKADESERSEREPRKVARTPSRPTSDSTPLSASASMQSPSTQVTPSLKIRLPRLNSLNNPASSSTASLESPTKRTICS